MSEFDLADLLATLETCREHLPLTLVPEHEARLQQITSLLGTIYTQDIVAAEQERSLYAAPADLFDWVAAFRTEQWAIEERPAFTTHPQANDTIDDLGTAEDTSVDAASDEEAFVDDAPDEAESRETQHVREARIIEALNYWHNPYTKLQEQTWRDRLHQVNRTARAILDDVQDHPYASAAQRAFHPDQEYVTPPEQHITPDDDPFSLPIDVHDPEHLIALTTWLFHPRTRSALSVNAWRYRRSVRHLRQLVDALPPNWESPAIVAAKAFLATLCTNCGHPGVLAAKHFRLCGHCSYVHPIGGPYSVFPLKPWTDRPHAAAEAN